MDHPLGVDGIPNSSWQRRVHSAVPEKGGYSGSKTGKYSILTNVRKSFPTYT